MTFASPGTWVRHLIAAGLALVFAGRADAQERDFCPERPGLDTPPCIVDRGHIVVEISAIDWTLDKQAARRTDTVLAGDAIVRVGLGERIEGEIGWTAFGHARVRDAGVVVRDAGTGDVALALKLNLLNPDGKNVSVAIRTFTTLPVGSSAIGAGTWSAGVQLPLNFSLNEMVQLIATPEIDAAADRDGNGRHLLWGSTAGVQVSLSDSVSFAVEAQLARDNDPTGHDTQAMGEASLAWQPGRNSQVDLGVAAGLNHNSPDLELIAGIARRF